MCSPHTHYDVWSAVTCIRKKCAVKLSSPHNPLWRFCHEYIDPNCWTLGRGYAASNDASQRFMSCSSKSKGSVQFVPGSASPWGFSEEMTIVYQSSYTTVMNIIVHFCPGVSQGPRSDTWTQERGAGEIWRTGLFTAFVEGKWTGNRFYGTLCLLDPQDVDHFLCSVASQDAEWTN